ncbi:carbohydrate esterase family 16 protein [Vararia minispora EC-137]|uniref:Carbohydrate esterase family 16 protein n=1 Tax=Vararia minispora EC-137 TaxID=1314806 RepID=A0ACB8QLF2_9AGAM|nr:carbohydrate esterase family 16 protein [Vararia minispora EC-137]
MRVQASSAIATSAALAASVPAIGLNDGIHLAVHPTCGMLGGTFQDVNAGIDLSIVKTIVSFGDSYTDGGRHDGGPLAPPVIIPPSSLAGGRSTNGPVWVEDIANDLNATLKDYAVAGAVVNLTLWPSNPRPADFLQQMTVFLDQSNDLDPDTTLYTIFFGINDWIASMIDGDHLPEAAEELLSQIAILASPPTSGRSFLVTDVYGRGTHTATGEAWKQAVFDGLSAFHAGKNVPAPLNVAYGDFSHIWDGVLDGPPGYKAFGYKNTSSCVQGSTLDGECDDPTHYFYWIPGHPSKETHRIMADYVEELLFKCN